jgi:lipid-A-disaccharide synthase-like uncharacterized protein
MECLLSAVTSTRKFVGGDLDFWVCLGWAGTAVFGARFFVQWWATERQKRVVVPTAFWWLSLTGSGLLLIYGIHRKDLVFMFSYLLNWIPYIRSLIIGHRMKRAEVQCVSCRTFSPGTANFCAHCGAKVDLLREAGQGTGA